MKEKERGRCPDSCHMW